MNHPKGHVLITVFLALFSFLSVGYMACKKDNAITSNDPCAQMTCKNGGVCFKGSCTCIAGFDGKNCEIPWITPYPGTWDVTEKIVGSVASGNKGKERKYILTLQAHSKPHMLFMQNLAGNGSFKDVEAIIGGKSGRTPTEFIINAKVFPNDPYNTRLARGFGSINSIGTMVSGQYVLAYIFDNLPIVDTINFEGTYKQ
ncbi:MAG: hypothetical protein EOP56_05275 [Sphingobacteriales bacterium]|nr:MAG: hypothetical protein EOP56_05275 [Sphingobacteriales bacterium]